MKTNNQTVLLVSAGILVIIVGGLWYLTHQAVKYPESESLATTTANLASSTNGTTNGKTTTTVPSKTVTTPVKTTVPPKTTPGGYIIPYITSFVPAAGTPGTRITIKGGDFDAQTNYVTFGTSAGRHYSDGTADNMIATVPSADGRTIIFTVPASGPSGYLCDANNSCAAISATPLQPGKYPITVRNKNGTTNTVLFTVM